MPTPSLILVPARFKTGKLYTPLATTSDGTVLGASGDFNVTRATTATRVNASGLIELVASGIPRLDYLASGGTVGCPALLVEPSGSNLAFHSSDWTSNWNAGVASGTTLVTNSALSLAPDGTATANEVYPTSGNTNHLRLSNSTTAITYVSGTVYTQSAFFKAGVGVGIRVQLNNTSARFSQLGYANFDLINGLVSVVSGTSADTNRSARIENYGNGWYRCSYTATCTSDGTGIGVIATLIAASGDTRSPSFSGTVTDYLLGWGAQLETGSVATSYIPTTTGSVTRNADVISVSGAVSGSIGQASGTIYAEVDVRNLAIETYIIRIDEGASSNIISLRKLNTNQIRTAIVAPTTSGTLNISSAAFTAGIIKIAFAYKSGEIALSVNGATALTANGTFAFGASLNRITLGSNASASSEFNDRIRAVALYTTRLSNAELAALTT